MGHPIKMGEGRFCTICGAALACINGHSLEVRDAAFCDECGVPLAAVAQTSPWGAKATGLGSGGKIGLVVLGVLAAGAGVSLFFAAVSGNDAHPSKVGSVLASAPGGNQAVSAVPSGTLTERPASATEGALKAGAGVVSTAAGGNGESVATTPRAPTAAASAAPTSTSIPPTGTARPPTATAAPPTNTPVPPTATPTQTPSIRVYGTMTVGGFPCGGCEASFIGPNQIVFAARANGSYDTNALGFALPPGSYKVYYTCKGQSISTGQTVVLVGPDVQFEIKIGFCG